MTVARTLEETDYFLSEIRKQGGPVGFIPTMGALHKGHLSLLDCCKPENDLTVISIFVNPTQFNDPADLEKYPRDLNKDLRLIKERGCDLVFVPDVTTIYPEPDRRTFDFGNLDKTMEGHFRPGHFNGVAQVVSRLFQIIKPSRAYFGKKDFQQLAIIRKMTSMLNLPVEIRSCPTIRESDGLAMSSRNALLNPEQRINAALINQTLNKAIKRTDLNMPELKKWVEDTINANPFLKVEYFEIVNSKSFQTVINRKECREEIIGCIAVRVGQIRLIDNIFFPKFTTS